MIEKKTAYWKDLADYDLETAEAMFQTKRWLYVAFMCHQAIEKMLKSYWCATREDNPPFIHNHKRIASDCGLYEQMDNGQRDFLETITTFNIEARYPEQKEELFKMLSPNTCRELIDHTKQLMQWITERL